MKRYVKNSGAGRGRLFIFAKNLSGRRNAPGPARVSEYLKKKFLEVMDQVKALSNVKPAPFYLSICRDWTIKSRVPNFAGIFPMG